MVRKIADKKRAGKKGVSEIVSYVLLIVIAISISTFVYVFLTRIVPHEKNTCPDEVSLIIKDYCFKTDNIINITFENKGTYTVDAVNVKIADKPEESVLPTKPLGGTDAYGKFVPNLEGTTYLGFNGLSSGREKSILFDHTYNSITKIQITPIIFQSIAKGKAPEFIFCNKAIITEEVDSDYITNPCLEPTTP